MLSLINNVQRFFMAEIDLQDMSSQQDTTFGNDTILWGEKFGESVITTNALKLNIERCINAIISKLLQKSLKIGIVKFDCKLSPGEHLNYVLIGICCILK